MPRARAVALPETLEHIRQQFGGDALPRVRHGQLDESLHAEQRHRDPPAVRREFDRIRKQIRDDLRKTIRIGARVSELRREVGEDLDSLLRRRRTRQIDRVTHDFRETHRARLDFELARADASEVEQVVHDLQLRLCTVFDARADGGNFRIVAPFQIQDPIPAQDCVERRTQLVRNHRQKLVLRPIRSFGLQPQVALLIECRSVLAPLGRDLTRLEARIARRDDQAIRSACGRPDGPTPQRYRLDPAVRPLRAHGQRDFRAGLECCTDRRGEPFSVLAVDPLLQLVPVELCVRWPPEFGLELGIGPQAQGPGVELAEAHPRGGENQLHFIATALERLVLDAPGDRRDA